MATVMDIEPIETRQGRRPYFSAIRWGAILAGVVSGSASYLLLTLLGLAVGLTAIDPQSTEPVGRVPLATGIWTGISMLVGAFIGGYVAGHMSGLSRSSDGMLHGFVSWGATTLLYGVLATSALGAILGGTFSALSSTVQGAAQTATQAPGAVEGLADKLMSTITGGGDIQASPEALGALKQAIASGNREQAIGIMVQDMGVSQERATQVVDKAMPLMSEQNIRQTADQATSALAATSWWLFLGLLLSLALGIVGGAAGVRAVGKRAAGDHTTERHARL
jgi:hypothetical protein